MIATFSQRRKEIIAEPLISAVMDRWPVLFSKRQVMICQLRTEWKSCILLLEQDSESMWSLLQ